MRQKLLKMKSHREWAWMLMIGFFALGIFNFYFGILGFICMIAPMYHAIKGKGKAHCSHFCPRGSLFMKFLPKVSLNRPLPSFMRKRWFKSVLLTVMVSMLTLAMVHSHGDPYKIGFALFRFMTISFTVGIVLGVFYKPQAWCQVCPMEHGTHLISKFKQRKQEYKKSA